ncbi:hypothetical protein [Massilia glaciei]|uniref:hypothetical protein n=1 Tax=Massilia glaciei TaxID=1524097 RepID=UPI0011B1F9D2|nr:hypothetical protein [Massilia glaciei]
MHVVSMESLEGSACGGGLDLLQKFGSASGTGGAGFGASKMTGGAGGENKSDWYIEQYSSQ